MLVDFVPQYALRRNGSSRSSIPYNAQWLYEDSSATKTKQESIFVEQLLIGSRGWQQGDGRSGPKKQPQN